MLSRTFFALLACLAFLQTAQAGQSLLFLEGQAVGGYSSAVKKPVYYSADSKETMQRSSAGFDSISKFSGAKGDIGTLAVQGRLAWAEEEREHIEPQIYNAYFNLKNSFSDVWIGHSRPAFGLSSYFDSHALLMPMLSMLGFGLDRDWGAGTSKDFNWGNLRTSFTSGSGMPLFLVGNWSASARVSKGVLERDNYNFGLSFQRARILETMGIHRMEEEPHESTLGSLDGTLLWNNLENRIEFVAGNKMHKNCYALLMRTGVNFFEGDRLKLEFQPVYTRTGDDDNHQFYGGVTTLISSRWSFRLLYRYDRLSDSHQGVGQIYFYSSL